MNSSSKLPSSISSSCDSSSSVLANSWTSGDSNGGVSEISNSSILRSLRSSMASLTFSLAPLKNQVKKESTVANGVAVITRRLNKNTRTKIGSARTSVTNATKGEETP